MSNVQAQHVRYVNQSQPPIWTFAIMSSLHTPKSATLAVQIPAIPSQFQISWPALAAGKMLTQSAVKVKVIRYLPGTLAGFSAQVVQRAR